MANTKISELTTAGTLAGSEVLPVVQSATTKKVTRDAFVTGGTADDTFIIDQYNSSYGQSVGAGWFNVDFSDQDGSIVAPYFYLPTGWHFESSPAPKNILYVPEGFYMIQFFFGSDSSVAGLGVEVQVSSVYGGSTNIPDFSYAVPLDDAYAYGSGTWVGRLHGVNTSSEAEIRASFYNNSGNTQSMYFRMTVTRLGD